MNANNKFSGCAFCRANKKSYNHPLKNNLGTVVCRELLQYKCPWCHITGHTTKHCTMTFEEVCAKREAERRERWEEGQRVKAAEQVKQAEIKASSWAAKITKKVSPATIAQMEENDKKIAHENAVKLAKATEDKRILYAEFRKKMEETFVSRMRTKYGIKTGFTMPAIKSKSYPFHELIPEKIIPAGEFWYFRIVGTKDEKFDVHGISRMNRENNKGFYHAYLKEKYWVNWVFHASDNPEDACPYLSQLCEQKERELEEEEWEWDQRERLAREECTKRLEEEEKEEEEMNRKLRAGEISGKQFNKWLFEKQDEEYSNDDDYHMSGLRLFEAMEEERIATSEWIARKKAREAAAAQK